MNQCEQCPRKCGAERKNGKNGYCGTGYKFRIARAAKHLWEEPPISGKNGSGTVFFSGCNLRCVYCQNREVSHEAFGQDVTEEELKAIFLRLRDEGAHNINLVTPTHYTEQLVPVLREVKPELGIPVVWNSGGYDAAGTLRKLGGLVDVYLPDFKYYSEDLAGKYSGAGDYREVATEALGEMIRQTGEPKIEDGLMKRGVIVRHLVLPGCRKDSIGVLRHLKETFGEKAFLLSLMGQYTPAFAGEGSDKNLQRRVTTFEYNEVVKEAERLGFDGFTQELTSATEKYTPDFHEKTF